jgi:hypothetical protein
MEMGYHSWGREAYSYLSALLECRYGHVEQMAWVIPAATSIDQGCPGGRWNYICIRQGPATAMTIRTFGLTVGC